MIEVRRGRELSITFNMHGERIERKGGDFIEKVVIPLTEKYPYAKIHIEVNS